MKHTVIYKAIAAAFVLVLLAESERPGERAQSVAASANTYKTALDPRPARIASPIRVTGEATLVNMRTGGFGVYAAGYLDEDPFRRQVMTDIANRGMTTRWRTERWMKMYREAIFSRPSE